MNATPILLSSLCAGSALGMDILITITFDRAPAVCQVEKCALKYGKDFAYSWSMDDGYICHYTAAWNLFRGGTPFRLDTVYEPSEGLYYTDGCGRDIPFSAGLAWNSVNGQGVDLHDETPGYMTWRQLIEVYTNGWDVINHSWSHATTLPFDRDHEIRQNIAHVSNRTDGLIVMNNWILPGGKDSSAYYREPFDPNTYGIKAAYGKTYPFGWHDYKAFIDPPHTNFNLRRRFIFSNADTTLDTYRKEVDLLAAQCVDGVHGWINEFSHLVGKPEHYGGSIRFPDFRAYMEYLAATYGKDGSDRIWFAGPQTVNEYLKHRDACVLHKTIEDKIMTIRVDRSAVPDYLSHYALSLMVQADASIVDIAVTGNISHSINLDTGLINLEVLPTRI